MENLDDDVGVTTAISDESGQNLIPPIGENINNSEGISENVQPTLENNMLSDINLCHKQDIINISHDKNTEEKTEIGDRSSEPESAEDGTAAPVDSNVNRNDKSELVGQEVSGVNHITEKYQEYEQEGNQSTEFGSEYVLETVDKSAVESENQDSSQGSSRKLESDGNDLNNATNKANISPNDAMIDKISDKPIESVCEETNLVSDDCTENGADNQNLVQQDQGNTNQQLNTDSIKSEYSNTENVKNVSQELPDNMYDGSVREISANEGSLQENVTENIVEDNITENNVQDNTTENIGNAKDNINENIVQHNVTENIVEEDTVHNTGDNCLEDVKQETNAIEVDGNYSGAHKDQNTVTPNNEAVMEEVITSNDELIETSDIVNISTVTSDSMSVEGFTIAEGTEVTEIQEGEYTIVEGPSSLDISTSQLEEPNNSDDTHFILLENSENSEENFQTDNQEETYLTDLRSEAESRQSVSSQASETKPSRRGRKPTYDIPMHVLGHDISKPVEAVPNGRALPRPRLGVKVPYRNLTSQIVSKADIEKEVMDRVRLKQEQVGSRADVLFARKLTQRLARKIAPSPDPPRKNTEPKKPKETKKDIQRKETETVSDVSNQAEDDQRQDNLKIHNDSDLLAILEGEGEEMPVLPKEISLPHMDDSNLRLIEREIALQQLQDLPHQAPKNRIYRGRNTKAPTLTPEASSKPKVTEKSNTSVKQTTSKENSITTSKNDQGHILSDKENETSKQFVSKDALAVSPKTSMSPKSDQTSIDMPSSPKKQPIEVEPQVKVNMVLKTYSRKRKTIELPETPVEEQLPKKILLEESEIKPEKSDTALPSNVYVTKSSRVIKKKVIWDPDEIPTRSPKLLTKVDAQPPKMSTVKTIKPVEKVANTDKVPEKKIVTEKLIKEKTPTNRKSVPSPSEKKATISKSDMLKTKTPIKNKKNRSEVDKLLMDEGAVKMLYELKNNDESASKKKKDVYSVDKAHKEIMKKANEIKSDLQQTTNNESPKSLRKKESFTPSPLKSAQITYNNERKMSKDSTRSSLHTPPGSPAYSFQHTQSSMLVRRRSSSSISSSDEVDANNTSKTSRKRSLANSESSKSKKSKKDEVSQIRESLEQLSEVTVDSSKPPIESKSNTYKSFNVKKNNKHASIDLTYIDEKCYCTAEILEELTTALRKFAKEKDCHIVSITSSSKAFCLGLDYSSLISDQEEIRKNKAQHLAEKVKEFLQCLLNFPKVLIAGIQGECIGLGVTMLPLFDMVIASDTATFSTPYASLGCVAEAGFLLSPPIFTNHGLASELLYTTQKINADDAFRRGLITRLCWPEKYNETLKNIAVSVSKGSKQSLVATKKQLRRHLVQTAEAALNSETKLLVEHWISSECQKSFASINENTVE